MTEQGSVLILGATSDMARAIAHAYAAEGRRLVLTARDAGALLADIADLRIRYGVEVQTVTFDILDANAHATLFHALSEFPETVVCAIGFMGEQPVAQTNAAHAEAIMRTNYMEPALLLDHLATGMEVRGHGTIIGISSVAGDRGRASNYFYGSAKAGFTAYLSGLRNRLATKGVHVVTVKPGFTHTRMTEGMKLPEALTAQPEEVARAVLKADRKKKNVIYVRPIWRFIMLAIMHIPERIFKRMNL
jgi:short-subunit dehydrogenase